MSGKILAAGAMGALLGAVGVYVYEDHRRNAPSARSGAAEPETTAAPWHESKLYLDRGDVKVARRNLRRRAGGRS